MKKSCFSTLLVAGAPRSRFNDDLPKTFIQIRRDGILMATIRLVLLCALFFIVAQPATAQSAPWGITAQGLSSSTIRLTWSFGGIPGPGGFRIERSTDGLSFTWIANVDKAAREYTDTGLPAANTYFYRMQSYKGRRLSAYSAIASA